MTLHLSGLGGWGCLFTHWGIWEPDTFGAALEEVGHAEGIIVDAEIKEVLEEEEDKDGVEMFLLAMGTVSVV
jgi:hypothetical protein